MRSWRFIAKYKHDAWIQETDETEASKQRSDLVRRHIGKREGPGDEVATSLSRRLHFHHAIRFLGHLWLKKIITESPYRPLEGVPAPPPPPPAANAHLSNGNTFLEMSTQEANENSRENLDHFWSYPPLVKTIHAFIIPLLCHFTI